MGQGHLDVKTTLLLCTFMISSTSYYSILFGVGVAAILVLFKLLLPAHL